MKLIDLDFDKDNRFYILTSTIPKAGFGLFAKENIKIGDRLYVYGFRISLDSDTNICTGYARNYKFADPADSKKCIMPVSYAGMINQNLIEYKNAEICNDGINVYFEFLRDIYIDEEIFTHYGDGWCDINNSVMAFIKNKLELRI